MYQYLEYSDVNLNGVHITSSLFLHIRHQYIDFDVNFWASNYSAKLILIMIAIKNLIHLLASD